MINIRTDAGLPRRRKVRAARYGTLAVNKMLDAPPGVRSWTLTHVPTGCAIVASLDRRLVVRLAKRWERYSSPSTTVMRASRLMRKVMGPKVVPLLSRQDAYR